MLDAKRGSNSKIFQQCRLTSAGASYECFQLASAITCAVRRRKFSTDDLLNSFIVKQTVAVLAQHHKNAPFLLSVIHGPLESLSINLGLCCKLQFSKFNSIVLSFSFA